MTAAGGTITNNGSIRIDATAGSTYLRANGVVTLIGSGSLELAHDTFAIVDSDGTYGGSFINGADHTIKGTGRILAAIDNNGEIVAQNGILTTQSPVTGAGSAETADNATLNIQQNLGAGDFTMANLGTLQVAVNRVVTLTGDFTFYQTDETKWNWSVPSSLQMSGAGTQKQTLEIGGRDLGQVMAGFSDNFQLPSLLLGDSGTIVTLVDEIDNGNRSSPEALYVGSLTVNTGTTLYLNGLNLYTIYGTPEVPIVMQVNPGSGYFWRRHNCVHTRRHLLCGYPKRQRYQRRQRRASLADPSPCHRRSQSLINPDRDMLLTGEASYGTYYVAIAWHLELMPSPKSAVVRRVKSTSTCCTWPGTYSVATGEADEPMHLEQENVTIVGEDGNPPAIIDGTGAQNWSTGLEMTGENLILQNMSVTGFSDDDEEGIRITEGLNCQIRTCQVYGNNWGIRVSFSSDTLVSDCDIYQNSTHGIDLTWGADNDVIDNRIHDNPMYGVRVESGGESIPEISRNLIYDNNYGIVVEAPAESSTNSSPLIQNNVIYQTETPEVTMSYGIFILKENFEYVSPEIYHNTIDGGTLSGIKMQNTEIETDLLPVIKYNIITNFDQYGIENIGAVPTIDYNDVWNTSAIANYQGCTAGTHDITPPADPKYASYSLQSDSPCINTIPPAQEDPVDVDYPGYLRPRPGEENKDMGAYEYVADETVDYTLPTGTGLETDYRIFSIPLSLGTGADMLTAMENVLGVYDDTTWRGFLYNGTGYDEFNSGAFGSHSIVPGMGYWIITTLTDTIPFTGKPAPDGVDYVTELAPGWHIIAPPWSNATVYLGNIEVTDGVNTYPITSTENGLTQQFLWDYTGNGAYSGYEMRGVGSLLQNDTGYFINVLSDKAIKLIIPIGEGLGNDASFDTASSQVKTVQTDETPPPPPGASPVPDIKANGMDGPVSVAKGDPVSITVKLDPGAWIGRNADWWVAAHTPFDPPGDWYTYVHPNGWGTGIHACLQTPIFEVISPFPVLNMVLPPGGYTFYFAVDGNMDGKPDATWLDAVQVTVE